MINLHLKAHSPSSLRRQYDPNYQFQPLSCGDNSKLNPLNLQKQSLSRSSQRTVILASGWKVGLQLQFTTGSVVRASHII
jgi:hypothetical protein